MNQKTLQSKIKTIKTYIELFKLKSFTEDIWTIWDAEKIAEKSMNPDPCAPPRKIIQ
jgi:hypothetical protein